MKTPVAAPPAGGASITTRRVAANGLGFTVHEAGTPVHGTPSVLLLHGFPEIGRYWWPTMQALAGRFHLVAPDLRGCGASDAPHDPDDYGIVTLLADVQALIDTLGLGPVQLVGHDWGGVLAWWLAAEQPRRVRRLVVCNAPHPAAFQQRLECDARQQAASAYIERLRGPGAAERLMAEGAEALWQRLRGEAHGYDAQDRAAWVASWRARGIAGGVGWYRAAPFVVGGPVPADVTERLNRLIVTQPTLVVWGDLDRSFVPELAEESAAFAAHRQVLRIAAAAHHPPRETPAAFAQALADFLAGDGAEPRPRPAR